MPEIAVIMPAYNAARFIRQSINSVQAQSFEDWHLYVVDDGSTDNTAEIVSEICTGDGRITLLRKENGGVSSARNFGIRNSESALISLLDADDIYDPQYLSSMSAALDEDPDAAICCCDAYLFKDQPGTQKRSSDTMPMVEPATLERVISRAFNVYTAATMRRSWFEGVGGYDESLKTAEDFDLWLRILAAGGKIKFLDAPLTNHRISGSSLSRNELQLNRDTLQVYENLAKKNQHVASVCDPEIRRLRHNIALHQAKDALKHQQFAEFFSFADEALATGNNPKLKAVTVLAKLSPRLTWTLVGRHI